jgi:uncharacterized protein
VGRNVQSSQEETRATGVDGDRGPRPQDREEGPSGPAAPTASSAALLRPLHFHATRLDERGMLGAWQALNRAATIDHCIAHLETSGNLDNFRRLVGSSTADYRGYWFADSDVYKVLEAIGWETGRAGDGGWDAFVSETIALLRSAQEDDGYLNSWIQGVHPERRWATLEHSHELYCLGHLTQGAIALSRATGLQELLTVARDFADLAVRELGPDGVEAIDGHPEVETALVELYRHTGERDYLALAERMVELRGRGLLPHGRFGAQYLQDHAPVREATEATGHAVRQLYLAAGVTDVYLETGDATLLDAMETLWRSVFDEKTYVTGAHGSRHRDEAFGDPYELPPDRAYGETCAAIASFMWNWRLLLATGRGRYAEAMERALYNAIAVSPAVDGRHFFYSNPLHLRAGHDGSNEDAPSERLSWYACSCCPPNVARLIGSLHHYVASSNDDGVQLHLLTAGRVAAGPATLDVATDYPWDGRAEITVEGAPAEWELALRIPSWCTRATVTVDGQAEDARADDDGYVRLRRTWSDGSRIVLELDMPVRVIAAHPRVDAVRGCVALARGPIVYCVEQADYEDAAVEDLRIDPDDLPQPGGPDEALGVPVTLVGRATIDATHPPTLYGEYAGRAASASATTRLKAIPYFRWANRGPNAMRVWIPTAAGGET